MSLPSAAELRRQLKEFKEYARSLGMTHGYVKEKADLISAEIEDGELAAARDRIEDAYSDIEELVA